MRIEEEFASADFKFKKTLRSSTMNEELKKLFEELKAEGASGKEMEELIPVLNKLAVIKKHERSYILKRKFLEDKVVSSKRSTFFVKWFFAPAIAFSLLLFVGAVSASYASQKSLPGDPLYPVKRLTEDARTLIDPNFKNEKIVRRSEEIKKLTEEKEEKPKFINKAIDDFRKESEDSRTHDTKKVQESLKNLEDAKQNVSGEEKKQIERVIEKTENNQDNKEVKSLEGNKNEDEKNK